MSFTSKIYVHFHRKIIYFRTIDSFVCYYKGVLAMQFDVLNIEFDVLYIENLSTFHRKNIYFCTIDSFVCYYKRVENKISN